MPALLHPGVYVQEVPSKVRAIEGAQTSTTIFVGETERGPIGPTNSRGCSVGMSGLWTLPARPPVRPPAAS